MPDRRSSLREPAPDRRHRTVGTTRAVRSLKARHAAKRSFLEGVADRLTQIASSGYFLALHVGWFILWIAWNTGLLRNLGVSPFDPFPFGLLTMVVSLEAIFLAIFIMMAQRRESSIAELREEITLQVLMRAEEEVTKTLQLVAGLYPRLGQTLAVDQDLEEMLRPLDADAIERQLTFQIEGTNHTRRERQSEEPMVVRQGEEGPPPA
ncbi:MAG: DUF1003 domain-containing protein [Gemmatimonadaceae bacterium]